jgi:2-polyprenyl-6-methoxyphenol hydroxylase-like FAD-dependent oxidoreductase
MGSHNGFRVLIVGGGTCGLAIAQGLQKVSVYVYLASKTYLERPQDSLH